MTNKKISALTAATVPLAGTVGQPIGWLCTVTGTPGTWVSIGNL